MRKGTKVLVLNRLEAAVEGVFEGLEQVETWGGRVWQPALVNVNGETLRCMPFDLQPIVRVVTPQEAAAEPERKYVLVELNVCTEVERVVQQDGEFVAVVFAGLLQKPIKEGAVLAKV